MIAFAALCPGPPLMAAELSGADPDAAELRAASLEVVSRLVACAPDVIVVIGPAQTTASWPTRARLDVAGYGGLARRSDTPVAPLSVGVGALLLDVVGYAGPRVLRSIAADADSAQCLRLGDELAGAADRVGLLVIADGSARRTVKAPGYFDARAEAYDRQVELAVAAGEPARLRRLNPVLAGELMAGGWPALQVLAAALGSGPVTGQVRYAQAPFGVGYLVASLVPADCG